MSDMEYFSAPGFSLLSSFVTIPCSRLLARENLLLLPGKTPHTQTLRFLFIL
jgi:hypothetical protein